MAIRRLILILVSGIAALGAVSSAAQAAEGITRVPVPGGAYTNVTAPALKKMLESKDFFFANVHVPYEREIAGTGAFTPFDQVEKQAHLLPTSEDAYERSRP